MDGLSLKTIKSYQHSILKLKHQYNPGYSKNKAFKKLQPVPYLEFFEQEIGADIVSLIPGEGGGRDDTYTYSHFVGSPQPPPPSPILAADLFPVVPSHAPSNQFRFSFKRNVHCFLFPLL